jgi:hypothetical protein
MEPTTDHPELESNSPDKPRRRIRLAQVMLAGAAAISALALLTAVRPATAESVAASTSPASVGGFADDPSDPGWNPPVDPGSTFPTNPGWSSQTDPGWNADPGWDFQPSP